MAIISAFQAEDTGSTPVTRSSYSKKDDYLSSFLLFSGNRESNGWERDEFPFRRKETITSVDGYE